jgi:hypothetical protein
MIRIASKFDKTRIVLLLGTKFKLVVAKPHEAPRLISLVLTLSNPTVPTQERS